MESRVEARSKLTLIYLVYLLCFSFVFFGLAGARVPFVLAAAAAYLSFPLIRWLEIKGLHRSWAVLSVFFLLIVAGALALGFLFPLVFREAKEFLTELPHYTAIAIERANSLAQSWGIEPNWTPAEIKEFVSVQIAKVSGKLLQSTTRGLLTTLSFFLLPIFYFHLISNFEGISQEVRRLVPGRWRRTYARYTAYADQVVRSYVIGQLSVCMALGILYGLGFWIVGVKYGLIIGVGTGLVSFVPYLGSISGFVTAITMAVATGEGILVLAAVVGVFGVIQAIEGLYITPRLVGQSVGLGILPTMLALLVGGNLFGILGMIVAIPSTAIAARILRDLRDCAEDSRWFRS